MPAWTRPQVVLVRQGVLGSWHKEAWAGPSGDIQGLTEPVHLSTDCVLEASSCAASKLIPGGRSCAFSQCCSQANTCVRKTCNLCNLFMDSSSYATALHFFHHLQISKCKTVQERMFQFLMLWASPFFSLHEICLKSRDVFLFPLSTQDSWFRLARSRNQPLSSRSS